MPANHYFEGGGEIIPFYGGYLVGQGFRNSADSVGFIAKKYQIPFFSLQLINQKYYHLDTCLFGFLKPLPFVVGCNLGLIFVDTNQKLLNQDF